jgi:hypothetical protein
VRRPLSALAAGLVGAASARPATATPGPDSVAILANADVPGSVALAEAYAEARAVPPNRICALPLPPGPDIGLDVFRAALETPLRACLDAAGVTAEIEAIVLMRGVPLRVSLPAASGGGRVSLAAALGLWNTRRLADDTPVLGLAPGRLVPCGGEAMCLGAAWRNGYSGGRFRPGWSLDAVGIRHAPMLVTALFARSDADAARLIDQSVASDGVGPAEGVVMLMAGADPARGALDVEYDFVETALMTRGVPVARLPFEADRSGERLAGFVTGTASLGRAIEGNDFAPGALVDNLTSFGAVAENFDPGGAEAQVSIARWVAAGATGVHGTTDEPLNNCFPSRAFLVDAADGATLAEAFHSNLPFAYWHNLVLGDPMAAPHAIRPEVEIRPPDGAPGRVFITAGDPAGRGAPALRLLVDGIAVAAGTGELEVCAVPDETPRTWLAVAQAVDDDSPGAFWQPKGWRAVTLPLRPEAGACAAEDAATPPPDAEAGSSDAALPRADAMPGTPDFEGPPERDLGGGEGLDAGTLPVPDAHPVGDGASPDAGAFAADARSTTPDGAAPVGAVQRGGGSGGGCMVSAPGGPTGGAGSRTPAALVALFALATAAGRRIRRRPRAA